MEINTIMSEQQVTACVEDMFACNQKTAVMNEISKKSGSELKSLSPTLNFKHRELHKTATADNNFEQ